MMHKERYILKEKIIVVDPGHGTNGDPGAVGRSYGTKEADIALAISKFLKEELESFESPSFKVVMTREDDNGLSLSGRVALARTHRADLFVSIHLNSFSKESAEGNEVIYHGRSKIGPVVAKHIMDRLATMEGHKNRGIKSDLQLAPPSNRNPKGGFVVLRDTPMPAVLVECEFISNPKMEEKLRTEDFQKQYASLIAQGIVDYYRS